MTKKYQENQLLKKLINLFIRQSSKSLRLSSTKKFQKKLFKVYLKSVKESSTLQEFLEIAVQLEFISSYCADIVCQEQDKKVSVIDMFK